MLAAAACAAAASAGCGGDETPPRPLPLAEMVLQASDLDGAFVEFQRGRVKALDPRGESGRYGRRGGWQSGFRRAGSATTAGPLVVTSRVDAFADAAGARRDLALYRNASRPSLRVRVGSESFASTRTQRLGANRSRFYTVAWSDGRVTASLQVNGFDGRVTLADAERLARRQQRRIARALR